MKIKLHHVVNSFLIAFTLVGNAQNMNDRALWGSVCGTSNATYYNETLDKMLVSWRMLPGDDASTSFDLYRSYSGKSEVKLNADPIFATNYQDKSISFSDRGGVGDVTYRLTYSGSDETIGTYTLRSSQRVGKRPYISIPLTGTSDVCETEGVSYQANDVSVGDLDGDGQMEIIVKRL
ncbi:MAG: hypothetical protein K2K25_05255, partial [Muribaculaceae bacterium]|nr:hypothetical protein [Muribaculaceae bacterium]